MSVLSSQRSIDVRVRITSDVENTSRRTAGQRGETTPSAHAALNELYVLGFDYDKSYDERFNAIASDDLERVTKTYLDVVVIGIAGEKE